MQLVKFGTYRDPGNLSVCMTPSSSSIFHLIVPFPLTGDFSPDGPITPPGSPGSSGPIDSKWALLFEMHREAPLSTMIMNESESNGSSIGLRRSPCCGSCCDGHAKSIGLMISLLVLFAIRDGRRADARM